MTNSRAPASIFQIGSGTSYPSRAYPRPQAWRGAWAAASVAGRSSGRDWVENAARSLARHIPPAIGPVRRLWSSPAPEPFAVRDRAIRRLPQDRTQTRPHHGAGVSATRRCRDRNSWIMANVSRAPHRCCFGCEARKKSDAGESFWNNLPRHSFAKFVRVTRHEIARPDARSGPIPMRLTMTLKGGKP